MTGNKAGAAGGKLPLGLYFHIPFCRQKCLYCDFLSGPGTPEMITAYVAALQEQLSREAPAYAGYEVSTVFFGGGTPSLLAPEQIQALLELTRRHFWLAEDAEITMESNPGTLCTAKLEGYRRAGVNRLSMGLQSANDAELEALGRIHRYSDFLENFYGARQAGFANINVDLMSALPGQTLPGWLDTLQKTAELGPEHISAYSLIIEEGTPFYERYGRENRDSRFLPLPAEEEERLMYEQTQRLLASYGYHRYEISNYAQKGKECRHNRGYWKRTDYLGLGLGASSLVSNVRWKNTEDLQEYLALYGKDKKGPDCHREIQFLTRSEQMEEFMFLGLRLTEGISLAAFNEQFGESLWEVYRPALEKLCGEGLLVFYDEDRWLKLTGRGVDVSNYALAEFLLDQ